MASGKWRKHSKGVSEPHTRHEHELAKQYMRAAQASLLQVADRRNESWTEEEDRVVENPGDYTTKEIGELLGRTWYAVSNRRHNLKNWRAEGRAVRYDNIRHLAIDRADHNIRHPRTFKVLCPCGRIDEDPHEDWCPDASIE